MKRNSYFGNLRRNTPQDRLQREVAYRHFPYVPCIKPVFEEETLENIDEEVKIVEVVEESVAEEIQMDTEEREETPIEPTEGNVVEEKSFPKFSYYGHGRNYIPQDRNVRLVSLRHRPYPIPVILSVDDEENSIANGTSRFFAQNKENNISEKANQVGQQMKQWFNGLVTGTKDVWTNLFKKPVVDSSVEEKTNLIPEVNEKKLPQIVTPITVEEEQIHEVHLDSQEAYYGHGRSYIPQDRHVRSVSLRHRPYAIPVVMEIEETPVTKEVPKKVVLKEPVKKPKLTREEKKQQKIQRKQDWLDEMIDRPKIRWFKVLTKPITYMHTVYEQGKPTIDGTKGCLFNLIAFALVSLCIGLLAYNHVRANEFSIVRINFIDLCWISLRVFGFGILVGFVAHLVILLIVRILHNPCGRRELVCGMNCSIVTILMLYLICAILMYFIPSFGLILFVVISLFALFLRFKALQICTNLSMIPLICIVVVLGCVVILLSLQYYNVAFMDLQRILALI